MGYPGRDAVVVWLFPYLPLSRRVAIGRWRIPCADLHDDDAVRCLGRRLQLVAAFVAAPPVILLPHPALYLRPSPP